jgi:hypothetical protein
MFVGDIHIQPSLIFAGKASTYSSVFVIDNNFKFLQSSKDPEQVHLSLIITNH